MKTNAAQQNDIGSFAFNQWIFEKIMLPTIKASAYSGGFLGVTNFFGVGRRKQSQN
jgi:hypothetical protein